MATITKQELEFWQAKTESSRFNWVEDEIVRLNGRGAMYYIGGAEKGSYMRISNDGLLTLGRYEDAFPHIGDATFWEKAKKQYENFDRAFEAAVRLGGKKFLVDMFSGNPFERFEVKPSVSEQLKSAEAREAPRPTRTKRGKSEPEL